MNLTKSMASTEYQDFLSQPRKDTNHHLRHIHISSEVNVQANYVNKRGENEENRLGCRSCWLRVLQEEQDKQILYPIYIYTTCLIGGITAAWQ